MSKKLKKDFFEERDAIHLAQDLLGKVICYNGNKYMITVTEAYPADDPCCYVNKEHEPFGKKCLLCCDDDIVNKEKPGSCFITPNGIHIIGGEFKKSKYGERAFDHVLIRGGIKVIEKNTLVFENPNMNLVEGRPDSLCRECFNMIPSNKEIENGKVLIAEFINSKSIVAKSDGRINLNDEKKRFYFFPILRYK